VQIHTEPRLTFGEYVEISVCQVCGEESGEAATPHHILSFTYFHWPIDFVAFCDSQDEKVIDFECHHESGSSSIGWKGN
jgi:hypothetical protein